MTCADPAQDLQSQNGGQCPCEDDPAWADQYGRTCSSIASDDYYRSQCSHYADEAGVTAAVACPVSCQSDCALTFDNCCELPAHLLSPCWLIHLSHSSLSSVTCLLISVSLLLHSSHLLTSSCSVSHTSPTLLSFCHFCFVSCTFISCLSHFSLRSLTSFEPSHCKS